MLSRHSYLADFNPHHSVFLQLPTLKSLKRFKSRALIPPVIILETKERTLPPGEEDNLINMGLYMESLEGWACAAAAEEDATRELCVCVCV